MLEGAQNQYEISSGLVDKNLNRLTEYWMLHRKIVPLCCDFLGFFWWGGFGFFLHLLQRRKNVSNLDGMRGFFFPQLLIFPDTDVTYNKLLLFLSKMFGFKVLDYFTVTNFQLNFWSFFTSIGNLKLTIKV